MTTKGSSDHCCGDRADGGEIEGGHPAIIVLYGYHGQLNELWHTILTKASQRSIESSPAHLTSIICHQADIRRTFGVPLGVPNWLTSIHDSHYLQIDFYSDEYYLVIDGNFKVLGEVNIFMH